MAFGRRRKARSLTSSPQGEMRGGVEYGDTQNRKYAGIINLGRNDSIRFLARADAYVGWTHQNTLSVWLPTRALNMQQEKAKGGNMKIIGKTERGYITEIGRDELANFVGYYSESNVPNPHSSYSGLGPFNVGDEVYVGKMYNQLYNLARISDQANRSVGNSS